MDYQTLSANVGVKNVNETVKFYTEILGFDLLMSVPDSGELSWAMLKSGRAVIMFQEVGNLQDEYPQLKGRSLSACLTFYVKMHNMMSLYARIKDTGYLAKELHKTFYGADEFAVFDNNGNILTIASDDDELMFFKNYDNFFLPADKYDETKYFYSEVLQLKKKFEFPEAGMIAFNVGGEEPAIILKDKSKHPDAEPVIWMETDDVIGLYNALKDKGVKFLSEPFEIRTGMAVEFTDPSGNRLGFTDYCLK